MTHRQLKISLVAGALAVAGIIGGFFLLFEKVEEEEDIGFQGEARLNDFLAAERLFTRLGVAANSSFDDWEIPEVGTALLLLNAQRSLSEERSTEILDWVASGGNLVTILPDAPSLDPLMLHFGVDVAEPEEVTDEILKDETVEVPWSAGEKSLKVKVFGIRRLLVPEHGPDDGPEIQAGSSRGTFLLRYPHGEGWVTILSEADFLTNLFIGQEDHARLAWTLVQGQKIPVQGVLLVIRDEMPSLFAWLARHAWAALLSAALVLIAWLKLTGSRLGPVLPDPPRDRRSLLEHVQASGEFLWKAGHASELVQSTRQSLLRRVELRQPTWAKLPPRDLVRRLGTAAGLPLPQVEQALFGHPQGDPAAFTSTIQTLETLRRSL